MIVFLPIKPEYALPIFEGDKKYEFRKSAFKEDVHTVVVYASSPMKKIIGYFHVKDIHKRGIRSTWDRFGREYGMIKRKDFYNYFEGKSIAISIEVGEISKFSEPIEPSSIFSDFKIPQSFSYLEEEEFEKIMEHAFAVEV